MFGFLLWWQMSQCLCCTANECEIIERSSANLDVFRFCGAAALNTVEIPVSTRWCAHSRLRNYFGLSFANVIDFGI